MENPSKPKISDGTWLYNYQGIDIYLANEDRLTLIEESKAKKILIVGETGSGKTTLVNLFVNYFRKVQLNDPYRYVVYDLETAQDQTNSQTKDIKYYRFKNSDGTPYILIDTPGTCDTRGFIVENERKEKIRNFLCKNCQSLYAICFVIKASVTRLTDMQRYVFDDILRFYGNEVKENIFFMLPFSDKCTPKALNAIRSLNLGEKSYKFNNSALLPKSSKEAEESVENVYNINSSTTNFDWKMGMDSMLMFTTKLKTTELVLLTNTKKVLQIRDIIDNSLDKLQIKIDEGLENRKSLNRVIGRIKKLTSDFNHGDGNIKFQVLEKELINYSLEIEKIQLEYDAITKSILVAYDEVVESQKVLNKIALKPKIEDFEQFLSIIIMNERNRKLEGWEERVNAIGKHKRRDKILFGTQNQDSKNFIEDQVGKRCFTISNEDKEQIVLEYIVLGNKDPPFEVINKSK